MIETLRLCALPALYFCNIRCRYTTEAAEAFYSGGMVPLLPRCIFVTSCTGMGGRTVQLGVAGKEKRSFTHVIPSQGLVLLVELEVMKLDHGKRA